MNEAFVAIRNVAETNEKDTTTTTKSLNLVLVEEKRKHSGGWNGVGSDPTRVNWNGMNAPTVGDEET